MCCHPGRLDSVSRHPNSIWLWDWNDPAVRDYPHLKLKLVTSALGGFVVLGLLAWFVPFSNSGLTAPERLAAVTLGWLFCCVIGYGLVLGNVRRVVGTQQVPEADRS
jgi:hypothetical protein